MRILDLALKDLSQILRDRKSLVFLVAMPIVFTLFMGVAFSGTTGDDENADTRIPLAVVNPEPDADLNQALLTRLTASSTIHPLTFSDSEAIDALQTGDVVGILVIPVGFSAQAEAGEIPQLKLIAEATSSEGQSLYQLLRVPLSQLMSAVEIAHLSAEIQNNPAEYSPALDLAWQKWNENARLSLVRIEQVTAPEQSDWTGGNPYNQASPGILVQFTIMSLTTSAQIFVQEKKNRTLQRLMMTAMKPWEIVAGHLLSMFTLTFVQTALLVIFGQLVLSVDYLSAPLGTLLISVALGLWVAAMGLLIGVLAKNDDQVVLFSLIAMFIFSALGGAWFPLEVAGGTFSAIGRLTASAWAMTGYQNILIRGLDVSSAWGPTGVLLSYAAGFFALAVWRFRKMAL
ncbi:MAG TPA: ABC transporter permease [Anaerolineales bacterium]|nr:ABC transporter permease [Anaerolineales bacterium]